MASGEFRLRVRYRKAGRLRFLSHLELTRTMERAVRRAGLPHTLTQGFNARMKAAFGPALPVGTASEVEYLDLWLSRYTAADEALRRLAGALPSGLEPVEAAYVADRAPALTAGESAADYEMEIDRKGVSAEDLQAAVGSLVAQGTVNVEHRGKTKVFELKRALRNEPRFEVAEDGSVRVHLTVRIAQEGALRPDVFVDTAFALAELPARVVSVTRTGFFSLDEKGTPTRPI